MNLDLTQADQSEVESKKNWTPLLIVVGVIILYFTFRRFL